MFKAYFLALLSGVTSGAMVGWGHIECWGSSSSLMHTGQMPHLLYYHSSLELNHLIYFLIKSFSAFLFLQTTGIGNYALSPSSIIHRQKGWCNFVIKCSQYPETFSTCFWGPQEHYLIQKLSHWLGGEWVSHWVMLQPRESTCCFWYSLII